MVALQVAHLDRLDPRLDAAVAHRQAVRRVVVERVAAPLGLQHQREGRIAGDVEGFEMWSIWTATLSVMKHPVVIFGIAS